MDKPCPNCGGTLLAPGALYAPSRLAFRPENARFLTLQTGDVLTKSLMCRDCGLVQVIGDVNKLRRLTTLTEPKPPA